MTLPGLALALGLALVQDPAAAPPPAAPAPTPEKPAEAPAPAPPEPKPEPKAEPKAEEAPAKAPEPPPVPRPEARPPPSPSPSPTPSASASPSRIPSPSPSPSPVPGPTPAAPPIPAPAPAKPTPEREQAVRAALAFLDALVAGDALALTAAAGERFSFDGDLRAGPDAIRRAWREALAARRANGPARLDDLELLTPPEALQRLGPPPARIASLTQRGGWVAIANLSGRPVVLFLAREGARMVVTGMHD